MTPKDIPHEHCLKHSEFQNRIENIEEETKQMRIDMNAIKSGSWSPSVVAALIGLFGTAMTVLGGLAGVAMSIFAKAHGWY